jgi:hypothetical protein
MTNNDRQGRARPRKQNPSKPREQKGKKSYRKNDSTYNHQLIPISTLRALQNETVGSHTLRLRIPTLTFPPSFFALFISLRILDLRNVGLRHLPGQIIELKNLERLDLRYNNLTYLPSQLAELPNLGYLQLDDNRDWRTRLLRDPDEHLAEQASAPTCSCVPNSRGHLVPRLPTLFQLCTRAAMASIPPLAADDTGGLSWEELEPLYRTGELSEEGTVQLTFAHVLPKTIPFDICSVCSEPVFPAHAQFDKIQIVALHRARLRYVLCSHQCYSILTERWIDEVSEAKERRAVRELRFRTKQDEIPR